MKDQMKAVFEHLYDVFSKRVIERCLVFPTCFILCELFGSVVETSKMDELHVSCCNAFLGARYSRGTGWKKIDFGKSIGRLHIRFRILRAKEVLQFISSESCPLFDDKEIVRPRWIANNAISEDHILMAIDGKKQCRGRSRRGVSKKELNSDEIAVYAVEELDKVMSTALITCRRARAFFYRSVGYLFDTWDDLGSTPSVRKSSLKIRLGKMPNGYRETLVRDIPITLSNGATIAGIALTCEQIRETNIRALDEVKEKHTWCRIDVEHDVVRYQKRNTCNDGSDGEIERVRREVNFVQVAENYIMNFTSSLSISEYLSVNPNA